MRFLLPILLCLSCFAQPNPINRRAVAIAGLASLPGPNSIPGLAYWWVASDIQVGLNAAVTNWIDRIQGVIATNAGTLRPLNTSTGVYFSGSTYLTNITINSAHTDPLSTFIIVSRDINDTGLRTIISGQGTLPSTSLWFNNATVGTAALVFGGSVTFLASGAGSHLKTNNFMTLVHDATTVAGGANQHFYTNGTLAMTLSSPDALIIKQFGHDPSGFLSGTIREIAVYTNVGLSSANVLTLETYSTSTYGYTP